jgi:nitrate reductase gamma subunit
MEGWLHLARGPFFQAALAFMLLGLLRQLTLTLWDARRTWRRAGDRTLPAGQVAGATLRWLVPVAHLRERWPYGVTTLVFHVGVILVPLFLAGHVALWERGVGLSWPALPNAVATVLTFAVLATALAVMGLRASARATRPLGRFQDYALPVLVAVVFASGLFVMHPAWNPLPADPTLLAHVLAADLLIALVPLTKLSHMILLPLTQLVSELAWHFPSDAGSKVAATLGKENEPI